MMKQSVACIGNGFVGGSLTTCFSEHGVDVWVFDKGGKLAQGGKLPEYGTESIQQLVHYCESLKQFSGIYFVCVPTPMSEDGSADVSIVESVLDELSIQILDDASNARFQKRIAVVKSTVPPGSTERWNKKYENTPLRVIFSPEFLTEANALDDMRNQNRIVLGGPRPHINRVKQIFQTAFPNVPLIKTSSTTAEMVKYVTNCFLATKVALANEMSQICEALDHQGLNIDYDKVIEYAKLDTRLGNSHWSVPGPDGHLAFGGHCFPKDMNSLMFLARELGIDPKVMNGAWQKCLELRPPEHRDWEKMEGRAVSKKKNGKE